MARVSDGGKAPQRRRVPQQVRSRDRVERILEVTGELVVAGGVESVTTRSIAAAAEIPVASLYQYFADKESILVALVERDLAEVERQVAEDLAQVPVLSVATMVDTTMRAFVKVYRRRPSCVVIFIRGRTNPVIRDYCRRHNQKMAHNLFLTAQRAGMVVPDSTGLYAELAVEVSDRLFQIAFETSLDGDPHVIDEAVALVTSYLETHATQQGIVGVPR